MTNLENWLRMDSKTNTAVTYYGYSANPGALTSDSVWMIRRLNSGTSDIYYDYADNDFSFNKIWDNRASYFQLPSALTILETQVYYNYIFLRWNSISGVTKYNLSVFNPDGSYFRIYNNFVVNTNVITVKDLLNATNYTFSITATNNAGSSNLTTTISTL